MRRFAVVGVAVSIGVLAFAPSGVAASARVAALQVGLRAHGFDPGPVDGVRGPLTTSALRGLPAQARDPATGRSAARRDKRSGAADGRCSGSASSGSERSGGTSRCSSSGSGTTASASRAVDGRFTRKDGRCAPSLSASTWARSRTVSPVPRTYRSLAGTPRADDAWHVVAPGESFFSISARYHVSPWRLARRNRLAADDRHRPEPAARASRRARG